MVKPKHSIISLKEYNRLVSIKIKTVVFFKFELFYPYNEFYFGRESASNYLINLLAFPLMRIMYKPLSNL